MPRAHNATTLEPAIASPDPACAARRALRRCALSRAVLPKISMVRFVVGRDRALIPDLAEHLPGRGIWLKAKGDMLEAAGARGELARVIGRRVGMPVVVPGDLRERLVAGCERRITELLEEARRARRAVTEAQDLGAGGAAGCADLLLVATDASEQERARFPGAVAAGLSRAALGAIFGRRSLVHVGVRQGRLAAAIESTALRRVGLVAAERVTETV